MLLTLAACARVPTGVWMFTMAVEPLDEDACAQSVSHNFENAKTPEDAEDDDDWEESEDATWSERVFFGLIEARDEGAVLFVGSEAFPGSGEGGSWTFTWTTESWDESRLDHASGYQYEASVEQSATSELVGGFDGGAMSGEWHEESEDYASWLESDLWSEEAAELVGENGELPAGEYLVTEAWTKTEKGGKQVTVAANNSREGEECGGTSCTLSVTDACGWQYQLVGERTALAAESFESVSGAGQAEGGG